MKKVFLIGGMSESGKSTFGRYLDSKGITRLKIVTFMRMVMENEGHSGDFVEWNERAAFERPRWLHEEFTKQFLRWVNENGIECCCLESLYGPDLGLYMREQIGSRAVIVWVNMSQEIRLERQVIRENLASIEEAKAYLLPRDERKVAWHVPDIEPVADVLIDNSGTIDDLYRAADAMIAEHCPEVA
ncbi:MAG: hypothetical protein WC734_03755 [Patescibacteria group bacterium]|jgi:dephospho-CoA kinase